MKITSIETLRTEEFANVLWARVHSDAGIIGLGVWCDRQREPAFWQRQTFRD